MKHINQDLDFNKHIKRLRIDMIKDYLELGDSKFKKEIIRIANKL
jgi:hypothetical protein